MRCLACPTPAPFIGAFMAPGPQPVQTSSARRPKLVADALGVLVFGIADRMAAPADHQVRPRLVLQHPRIAQDVEYRIGDRCGVLRSRDGRRR